LSRWSKATKARRWPIEPADDFDPIDVLHHAIDEFGHSQTELAELLGLAPSRASEVLARKTRRLTVDMIHKIGEAWENPGPTCLVRPYKIERKRA